MPLEKVIVLITLSISTAVWVTGIPVPVRAAMSLPLMALRTALPAAMAIRTAMSRSRSFAGRLPALSQDTKLLKMQKHPNQINIIYITAIFK